MHIYVEIYGHRIPTYGLLITIGVILANLIAIICMKRKYKKDCIEDFFDCRSIYDGRGVSGSKMSVLVG